MNLISFSISYKKKQSLSDKMPEQCKIIVNNIHLDVFIKTTLNTQKTDYNFFCFIHEIKNSKCIIM